MQRSPLTGLRPRAMPRCGRPGFGCASGAREGKRPRMFPSASLLAFAGTLLMTVADKVPTLNVEAGCRAAAKMGDSLSLDTTLRQCLADENSARDQLEKQWTQFAGPAAALRDHHRDRRRSQLCRSSRLPADGARRGADGRPFRERSARQEMTQIMHVVVI